MTTDILITGINPEPWTSPEVGIGRKGGKTFPRFYASEALKNYKSALAEAVGDKLPDDWTVVQGVPFKLELYFWRQLEPYKSHQARTVRKHEADATNLAKAAEDALQGVLFDNDRDSFCTLSWIVEQGFDTPPAIYIKFAPHKGVPAPLIGEDILKQVANSARRSAPPTDEREDFDVEETF